MTKVTTATAVAEEQSGHDLESQHTGQENYRFEASLCIARILKNKQTNSHPHTHKTLYLVTGCGETNVFILTKFQLVADGIIKYRLLKADLSFYTVSVLTQASTPACRQTCSYHHNS